MKKEVVNIFGKEHNKVNALTTAENNTEDRLDLSFLKKKKSEMGLCKISLMFVK